MKSILSAVFKKKPSYRSLIINGAQIVDVRSQSEYDQGAVPGSIHIPLAEIGVRHTELDKSKAIIVVCASGVRSGIAKWILKSKNLGPIYNAGAWSSLFSHVN